MSVCVRVFLSLLSGMQIVFFSARHYDVICGQFGSTIFFHNFWRKKKAIEHKIRVLIYSATLTAKFLILRTIQRDIVINVHGSLCRVPVIPVRF